MQIDYEKLYDNPISFLNSFLENSDADEIDKIIVELENHFSDSAKVLSSQLFDFKASRKIDNELKVIQEKSSHFNKFLTDLASNSLDESTVKSESELFKPLKELDAKKRNLTTALSIIADNANWNDKLEERILQPIANRNFTTTMNDGIKKLNTVSQSIMDLQRNLEDTLRDEILKASRLERIYNMKNSLECHLSQALVKYLNESSLLIFNKETAQFPNIVYDFAFDDVDDGKLDNCLSTLIDILNIYTDLDRNEAAVHSYFGWWKTFSGDVWMKSVEAIKDESDHKLFYEIHTFFLIVMAQHTRLGESFKSSDPNTIPMGMLKGMQSIENDVRGYLEKSLVKREKIADFGSSLIQDTFSLFEKLASEKNRSSELILSGMAQTLFLSYEPVLKRIESDIFQASLSIQSLSQKLECPEDYSQSFENITNNILDKFRDLLSLNKTKFHGLFIIQLTNNFRNHLTRDVFNVLLKFAEKLSEKILSQSANKDISNFMIQLGGLSNLMFLISYSGHLYSSISEELVKEKTEILKFACPHSRILQDRLNYCSRDMKQERLSFESCLEASFDNLLETIYERLVFPVFRTINQTLISPVEDQLKTVQNIEIWHMNVPTEDNVLPDSGYLPQDYILNIGQYVLTIPDELSILLMNEKSNLSQIYERILSDFNQSLRLINSKHMNYSDDEIIAKIKFTTFPEWFENLCTRVVPEILLIAYLEMDKRTPVMRHENRKQPALTDHGAKQMAIDIGYYLNLLDDLYFEPSRELLQFKSLLLASRQDFAYIAKECSESIVKSVSNLRDITI